MSEPYSNEEGQRILAEVAAHPRRRIIETIAEVTFDIDDNGGMWWHLARAYLLVDALPALVLDENLLDDTPDYLIAHPAQDGAGDE